MEEEVGGCSLYHVLVGDLGNSNFGEVMSSIEFGDVMN